MKQKFTYITVILMPFLFGILTAQENISRTELIGLTFPDMEIEALSGKILNYPETMKGKVSLILIAFERETQEKIDTWLEPFFNKYNGTEDVTFYEIPMLKGRYRLVSTFIDGGMRSGIPVEKHDNVSTYYGNVDKYRKPLLMQDDSEAYIFLLDKKGVIQWIGSGSANDKELEDLYSKTEALRIGLK